MRVSDAILLGGIVLVLMAATFTTVVWPARTMDRGPSAQWQPLTPLEQEGRLRYIANGCTYCHSQYVRPQDWAEGAERIAKPGDYFMQQPHLLGSERTGPDVSEVGGEHSDDWHLAHFTNPRFTSPRSLMPRFAYEGKHNIEALIAYEQSLGGTSAGARMALQMRYRKQTLAAFAKGPDANIEWLHSRVPEGWRMVPTESPVTDASVARGEKVYQDFCIGCHGPVGDGNGPAHPYLKPTPVNFTILKRHLVDGKFIGGILYYQIMNGITGSAMPYFKKHLESAKIWDVGNYIEYSFINHRDDRYPSVGIPAAYEGEYSGQVKVKARPMPGMKHMGGMPVSFIGFWITYAVCGTVVFLAVLIWAIRAKQFTEFGRQARLALKAPPVEDDLPHRVPNRLETLGVLGVPVFALIVIAAVLWVAFASK